LYLLKPIGVQQFQPSRQIATVAPDRMTHYRGVPRPLLAVPQVPQAFKKPQMMTEALVSERFIVPEY
jgi:hypothetical protein